MKRISIILTAALILIPVVNAEKIKIRTVKPGPVEGPYSLIDDKIVYRDPNLVVTVMRIENSVDEARFCKARTGEPHNLFLGSDRPDLFQLYLLKIVNHSSETVIFNPGYASVNLKNDVLVLKDYTALYSFFNLHLPKKRPLFERIAPEIIYDRNEKLNPEESVTAFLVFDSLPDSRMKSFNLELSWLYMGQENVHLLFPYTVETRKIKI